MSSHKNTPDGGAVSRRDFLTSSAVAGAALLAGCATNPVTGERQLMLMTEAEEVNMDRKYAAHQFSSDYGASQDSGLNAYVSRVGLEMSEKTHRPAMPYNFRVVNNTVVNGYTMPAGSVGLARGLMLAMDDEAELAAVLGHELGHVNARHAAERMTKNLLLMAMVSGVSAYAAQEKAEYAELAAGLGGLGANLLLSRYSRDDERQADGLGMEYMTRAGHNPQGMVGLMDMMRGLHTTRPGAVELLFSTHPMSDERYETAKASVRNAYASSRDRQMQPQRYMDHTARLRAMKGAIEDMQKGQESMQGKKLDDADGYFQKALKAAPDDYAGLLMMAKCRLAQNRPGEAVSYAEKARGVYPDEPQADHVIGMARTNLRQFDRALSSFNRYAARLPGNNNTIFFQALCLEGMGRKADAADKFVSYRQAEPYGDFAPYVNQRLVEWGYAKPAGQ